MKLKYLLAIVLGAPIILITFTATFIFFLEVRDRFINEQVAHLESVTETKRIRVEDMLEKKQELLLLLSNHPELRAELMKESIDEVRLSSTLQEINALIPSILGFAIVDSTGETLLLTSEQFRGFPRKNLQVTGEDTLNVGDYFFTDTQGVHYHVLFFSAGSPEKGVYVFQDTRNIFSLTSGFSGLGRTGETVLVNSEGEHIAPTRFPVQAKGIADEIIEVLRTTDNGQVIVEGRDYRGEQVLASGTRIPRTEWFMYTKMSMSEIRTPVNELRLTLLFIDLIASLGAIVIGILVGNYLSERLNRIVVSLNRLKEGDLSFRSIISKGTEIGTVEAKLNEMASEVEKTVNLLNSSNEALNRYAYIVAHDIKGPAQAIYSLAGMVNSEYADKLDDQGKQMLAMLSEKSDNLQEMVTGILDSAKKGFSEEESQVIDANDLVEKVLNDQNIPENFNVEVEKDLPQVVYNPLLLYQVFQNLISNAVKYNDKEHGAISISCAKQGGQVTFVLKDNGPGIPEKLHKKVFEMFGKAHQDDTKDSFGIGLATVKKIITANNGTIWIESAPGEGAVFYFTVPAAEAEGKSGKQI